MKEVNSYGWKAVIGSSIGYAMDGFDPVSYTHLVEHLWKKTLIAYKNSFLNMKYMNLW